MKHVMSLPVPRRERGIMPASPTKSRPPARGSEAADQRWSLLNLVRTCRERLGLRDRDITVLRGLLSLIPATAHADERVVFASNRVLIERCDGIDERTLRRRIEHLQTHGLLVRRASPNGKRYQLRADGAEIRLTYGLDLAPLFKIRDHLVALADQCHQEVLHCKAMRAMIRDILFHHGKSLPADIAEAAIRSLRRMLSSDQLHAIVETLRQQGTATPVQEACETSVLTVSNSQNDRHIQSSYKKEFDSECAEEPASPGSAESSRPDEGGIDAADITVRECIDLAPNAAAFAAAPTRDWRDVVTLSQQLAPAIGLGTRDVERARQSLGVLGCALTVIGLVEAFGRIRNAQAYMHALVKRAETGKLDIVRMFRSLTKAAPRQAQQMERACIPR